MVLVESAWFDEFDGEFVLEAEDVDLGPDFELDVKLALPTTERTSVSSPNLSVFFRRTMSSDGECVRRWKRFEYLEALMWDRERWDEL